jgi:hypothetical protein
MIRACALAGIALSIVVACSELVVVGNLGADGQAAAADGGSDGDASSATCYSNADCPDAGWFCSKPDENCGGPGTCAALPMSCPPTSDAICDCTHSNQTNACEAHLHGSNVDYAGLCKANPLYDGPTPPDGSLPD